MIIIILFQLNRSAIYIKINLLELQFIDLSLFILSNYKNIKKKGEIIHIKNFKMDFNYHMVIIQHLKPRDILIKYNK